MRIIKNDVRPEAVSSIKAFKPENITAEVIPIAEGKKLA